MGQKDGEKWTAAVDLQPTLSKSDRLLGLSVSFPPMPPRLLGLVFAAIGGGIIVYGWWSATQEAHLREHGHLVQAEFQQVELNESLEVNGANPLRIVAQWHDSTNNRLCIFKSANPWFDPSAFVQGRKIPVYGDLAKPSRYHVDTSFLPSVHR
jgi:hypothetical protein